MTKSRGFTLVEFAVVIAVVLLLAALAILAFGRARGRANDARRVSDMERVVIAFADAHRNGAVLCSNDGTAACPTGTALHDCRLYKVSCTGDNRDDVTDTYIDLRAFADPVWAEPCTADRRTDCEYAFLVFDGLASYEIGFSSEGGAVVGLSSGRVHLTTQGGEMK